MYLALTLWNVPTTLRFTASARALVVTTGLAAGFLPHLSGETIICQAPALRGEVFGLEQTNFADFMRSRQSRVRGGRR